MGPNEVEAAPGVERETRSPGLTRDEARRRLAEHGPNALPRAKRPSFWARLARQFANALIYVLLLALGLDLVAWVWEGAERVPAEALAIAAVLVLNALLGVLQEYRSERALDELEKLGAPHAWVMRDGALERVAASELVPGDLVRLEAGERVPADGKAHRPESLGVDESLLTGESVPIDKEEGDELLCGTLIVRGHSELAVERTGLASAMGKLAGSLMVIESSQTPLERRISVLGNWVARVVGALSVLLFTLGIWVEGLERAPEVMMFAVAFAVAVVPEGMPAVMTLVLAFGVQRMARQNAVVRRLSAVEALGSVTVIASDKTGTLTSNRMVVGKLETSDDDAALRALVLANDAEYEHEAGDPLERGLLEFAAGRGADVRALKISHPRVASRPFDTRWKYLRATVVAPGGELRSYVKGAIEIVVGLSSLSELERADWLERAEREAAGGYKVLGLARGRGHAETELEFLGFVTLWDAPRPEAAPSVRAAEDAGITVMMITGDHPTTALAIAERVGIRSERSLTGTELEAMSDAELASALAHVRVFSRMLPEQKLRIVEALQARGEIVAMTGDGLNDAPALKRADVGVAMGKRGSDVAREVSDVVLLDDDFATIVTAIEEGRVIYENIQNFIRFTFSSNVALMVLVLGGAFGSMLLGLRAEDGALLLPLTAIQILWINFFGDGPPALALSLDRSPGVMRVPPRSPKSALLDGPASRFILLDGGFKGAVGLLLLVLMPMIGFSLPVTATAVFLYESVAKLVSAYPARRIGVAPEHNVWLHVSIAVGSALAIACLFLPPMRIALEVVPIDLAALGVVGAALVVTWTAGELLARTLSARQVAHNRR